MQIRTAEAGRGAGWLLDGFDYFKRDPLTWIGVTVLMFIVYFLLKLLPVVGGLVSQILSPVFAGGLVLGCKSQDSGGKLEINHLFAGFSADAAQLLLLGVFYTAGLIGIILIAALGALLFGFNFGQFASAMQSGNASGISVNFGVLLLPVLVAIGLSVPLLMAVWFAPALIVLDRKNAADAMKQSFNGCLANIMPFLVYGVVGLFLAIIATIPMGLGWLVFLPMVMASLYIGYKEIFSATVPAAAAGEPSPGPKV
ncbi:MAG: hypothetical protein HYY48_00830 [Gammaproteobacteria bacterium]|nr:hypothetical protein [Gammaproteobacteria bacterium]